MAMGTRKKRERQRDLWIAADQIVLTLSCKVRPAARDRFQQHKFAAA